MNTQSSSQTTTSTCSVMTNEQYASAYDLGYSKTRRFIASRGISPGMAEDIAQAAWAKGWERRDQVRDPQKVGVWVNTIALNLLRSSFHRPPTKEFRLDMAISPPTSSQTIDCRRILNQCSPSDRKLLEGCYMEGYTSGELGRLYGYTAVGVRVRLFRLRQRLQASLIGKLILRAA